jgi:hypothetical protein
VAHCGEVPRDAEAHESDEEEYSKRRGTNEPRTRVIKAMRHEKMIRRIDQIEALPERPSVDVQTEPDFGRENLLRQQLFTASRPQASRGSAEEIQARSEVLPSPRCVRAMKERLVP